MRAKWRLGQLLVALGATAGVAYLVWRVTISLTDTPGWLAGLALAVETLGIVASLLLVWAVWSVPFPRPASARSTTTPRSAAGEREGIDVVIRCSGQPLSAVTATLLASERAEGRVLLDLTDDPRLAALAHRHGARHIVAARDDLNGIAALVDALHHPRWFVLDAGDVPAPTAFEQLGELLDDPLVAIVVAPAMTIERDASAGGRCADTFVRGAVQPGLGAHGCAVFGGSGALVRAEAVVGRAISAASPEMMGAQLSTELMAAGWRLVAPAGPALLARAGPASAQDAELRRVAEASAARWLLTGSHGALAGGRLQPRRRLALLSHAVGPLSGIHRSLFVAVLLASMLEGRLPFRPDAVALALTWLPWFVLTPLGLVLLSGGSLRLGDRATASMRLLGPAWRGVLTPNGRPERPRLALAGAFGVRHGAALCGAVAAISIVVTLRGISDQLTHTLLPMNRAQTAGLLVVTLWTLAIGLEALHLLSGPARSRRSTRVTATIPGTVSGRSALLIDLTPEGAAVLTDAPEPVGTACAVEVVLPTSSGCVTAMLPATVRNAGVDAMGVHRLGVEFFEVDATVQQALVEYCVVEPVLARLDQVPGRPTSAASVNLPVDSDLPRHVGLRAAALVAVSGALASAVPASSNAAAPGSSAALAEGRRVVSAGVGSGAEMTWIVTAASAVIAVGVISSGLRSTRFRGSAPRVRRPFPLGR